MNTNEEQISTLSVFAQDSARAERARERYRRMAEATLEALREAGKARKEKELQAQKGQ